MQAVIRSGGKQYLVSQGQILIVDLVSSAAKKLEFAPLLVIDGENIAVGAPEVAGATVTAEVLGEVKGEKLKILKFKPKKRINKRTGHRQRYTEIKITAISATKRATAKATEKVSEPAEKSESKTKAPAGVT